MLVRNSLEGMKVSFLGFDTESFNFVLNSAFKVYICDKIRK